MKVAVRHRRVVFENVKVSGAWCIEEAITKSDQRFIVISEAMPCSHKSIPPSYLL